MNVNWRAACVGAAAALVVAVPVSAIGAAVVDDGSSVVYVLAVLAAIGYGAGGYVAAAQDGSAPVANGALAALGAYVVAQAIAVVVNLAGDDDINVAAVVFTAVPAVGFGMLGAAATERFGPARAS